MALPLTADRVKRLAFVRSLMFDAVRQLNQPEPFDAAALLSLHDALELFIGLFCNQLDLKPQDELMQQWEALRSHVEEPLPYREDVRKLSRARAQLKHHGVFPSRLDLEWFRDVTERFLAQACPQVFGVELRTVSLVDLIASNEAQESLRRAAASRERGDVYDFLRSLSVALEQLLHDFEASKKYQGLRSAFELSSLDRLPRYRMEPASSRLSESEGRFAAFTERLHDVLDEVERSLKVLALGIDFRRLARFRSLTPMSKRLADGNYVTMGLDWIADRSYSAEELDFCFGFVVSTGLSLYSENFDLIDEHQPRGTRSKDTE